MDWPIDADGNVLRSLQSHNFDFTIPHKIDFQIEFDAWPPSDEAVTTLKRDYAVELHGPEMDSSGYVQISIVALLTYDLVITIQNSLSQQLRPFGGTCEAWGVLS